MIQYSSTKFQHHHKTLYKRTVTPNNILIVLFNKTIKMLFGVTVLLYFIKILDGSRNYKTIVFTFLFKDFLYVYFRMFDAWRRYTSRGTCLRRFQRTKNDRLKENAWETWR